MRRRKGMEDTPPDDGNRVSTGIVQGLQRGGDRETEAVRHGDTSCDVVLPTLVVLFKY